MKKSFLNKEYILQIIFLLFSFIYPLFSYVNFPWYICRVVFIFILTRFIFHSFSFAKSTRIWGYLRICGIILSLYFFGLMCERYIMIQTDSWLMGKYPLDDDRFIKSLYAFLFSLAVLGIGEIIIYLRDIRFLLSLNKNNKDYFECDDCVGKGYIEKEENDELSQKNCKKCSGLGFLEKNSNHWFSRDFR